MKLSHRLILSSTLAIFVVLGVLGALGVRRESQLVKAMAQRELSAIAIIVEERLARAQATEGPDAVARVLARADTSLGRLRGVSVRWVPSTGGLPAEVQQGKQALVQQGEQFVFYVPVAGEGLPPGVLEIRRSYEEEHAGIARNISDLVILGVILAIVLALLMLAFGQIIVGRPLKQLAQQARQVASGDLSARVCVRRDDEIGEIAREMNHMGERLQRSQEAVAAEHAARIAGLLRLRHADRLATVGRLAAGVAHELGTPLNVVSGRSKMIASGERQGEAAIKSATIVAQQADRMAAIIRQLLNFARGAGGPRVRADLVPVARQMLGMLAPLAHKRQIELKLEAPATAVEAFVEVDQVEQALANLVVNGIDAMGKGGTLTVAIREEFAHPPPEVDGAAGNYLSLEVKDEGEGISPESLPHVFDPFFTTRPIGEGTGLGLSVAYGIVRDHGGWIDAASQIGRGSDFTIHLPAAR